MYWKHCAQGGVGECTQNAYKAQPNNTFGGCFCHVSADSEFLTEGVVFE